MPHKDRDERLEYLRRWKEKNRPSPTLQAQNRSVRQRTPAGLVASRDLPDFGAMRFSEDGALVQCHVCGEWGGNLNGHFRIHGLTAAEYKEAFGIPRTASTHPPALQEKNRAAAIARDQGHRGKHLDGSITRPVGLEPRLGVRVAASEARKGIYMRGGGKARKPELE